MHRGNTQQLFWVVLITVIAVAFFTFVYWTLRPYFAGPTILITSPANYAAFSTSTITITGIAERAQIITLDGRPITLDSKGNFSETILLLPGYNIETIAATDRFGHYTAQKLELVLLSPT
ncbi:MAG: hypothetical protein KGJ35_02560 [Patescibacteria group bacterium]|nr:hypothetical protein [Patescibacteria group bacterium]